MVEKLGVLSPFAATFALPLEMESTDAGGSEAFVSVADANLPLFFGYVGLVARVQRPAAAGDDAAVSSALARGGLSDWLCDDQLQSLRRADSAARRG